MKKIIVFSVFYVISFTFSMAQKYPKGYFTPPLDPPLVLTGTFGEIRDDHFHSGIDISTDEQEGVPVMSAGLGYISRIKISSDGYGKALYVTHPNGFVTVYGHLQKFTGPLDSYVRKIQYENQNFELDVKLLPKEFPVKQRDVIGYSGSTGGAEAPHLHFEIRDELSEEPINPLLFGLPVKDTMPPELKYITIFPLRENGIVDNTDSAETFSLRPDTVNNTLILNTGNYPIVWGNIAFGFNAVDHMDSSLTELGIFSAELYVDSVLTYSSEFDRFNFKDTRDVNAHIDYLKKTRDNLVIERCYRLPGNHLNFYSNLSYANNDSIKTGFTFFGEDFAHNIRLVVRDFSGNKSEITFQILSYSSLSENPYQPKPEEGLLVTNDKGVGIHKSKLDVVIPEGAVYENFYYDDEIIHGSNYLSAIYRVGDPYEALGRPITIGIKPGSEIPDSLKSKALIVRIVNDFILKSCGGQWDGKFLSAKSYNFGNFAITLDTIAPTVEKYYVPADMNSMWGGEVRIIIKDELSGIKSYSGKIDDKWTIFEYDKKNNMIIANVDALAVNLEHPIEITVTDERGNTTVWKSSFYY